MFFEESFETRPSDYDSRGRLSLEAILNILETSGGHHTEAVKDRVSDGHVSWIMADWRVAIERYPVRPEPLRVRTWVKAPASVSSVDRMFTVRDTEGSILIRASARLAQIDLRDNRLLRISPELSASYAPEAEDVFSGKAPRLRESSVSGTESRLHIRRSDVDFNRHVHNTKYACYAVEALPEEAFRNETFSSFRAAFHAPLKYGGDGVIRCSRTDSGYSFAIYDGECLCTLMELGY